MQDFSSRGTGNSRYLKSVSNFLTQYPTYESFAQALVNGTLPVDFNGINSSGVNQRGTPLNKANLLTDATAALYGMGTTATINQVLSLLGGTYGSSPIYYGVSTDISSIPAKTVTVSDKFRLEAGARVIVRFTNGSGTSPTLNVNSTGARRIKGSGSYNTSSPNTVYTWAAGMVIEFVYDGTYWIMVSPGAQSLYFVRGSYTGNGKYGTHNPTRILTGLYPVFGIIAQTSMTYDQPWNNTGILIPYVTGYHMLNVCVSGTWYNQVPYSYDASTGYLEFYAANDSAAYQLNTNGTTYHYAFAGSIVSPE